MGRRQGWKPKDRYRAFATRFAPEPIHWRVDPRRLSQVITNLLTNAYRNLGPGHTIEVVAEVRGSRPVIEIIDDGPGLPEAVREDPFERFRASTGGTGLSLSIVKKPVEAHGGTCSLEPRAGGGTIARRSGDTSPNPI